MAEVLESFDQGAADHPQLTQVGCMAQPDPQHGVAIMASSDEKTLAAAVVSWS